MCGDELKMGLSLCDPFTNSFAAMELIDRLSISGKPKSL
jgi:hypothetical protein